MSFWTKICSLFKKEEKKEDEHVFSRFPYKTKYEEQFDSTWRILSDILTIEYIDRYKSLMIKKNLYSVGSLTDDINYLQFMQQSHDAFARLFWKSKKEEIENDKSN